MARRSNFVVKNKAALIAHHGNACVNCGSSNVIEWHHVVPVELGGNDTIGNIVPLCPTCHGILTYGRMSQKVRRYEASQRGGRPRREIDEDIMFDYAVGLINHEEAKERAGITGGSHFMDAKAYKEYVNQNADSIRLARLIKDIPPLLVSQAIDTIEQGLTSLKEIFDEE